MSNLLGSNLLGNPVETAVAAAQLVFGGVLTAHPAMRVLLVHRGGCLPAVAGRWQRGADTNRPGIGALAEPPREAICRLFIDCLAHDPGLVDHAVAIFGQDRLVFGGDWPFPIGTSDPRAQIAHRGKAFVEQVANRDAIALLGRGIKKDRPRN